MHSASVWVRVESTEFSRKLQIRVTATQSDLLTNNWLLQFGSFTKAEAAIEWWNNAIVIPFILCGLQPPLISFANPCSNSSCWIDVKTVFVGQVCPRLFKHISRSRQSAFSTWCHVPCSDMSSTKFHVNGHFRPFLNNPSNPQTPNIYPDLNAH